MRLPIIHGYIDRRILVNFTADPEDVQKILPARFKPKMVKGKAVVGICLIRLKEIKPKGFPKFLGVSSENGAHRIAVEWEIGDKHYEGVYIPRRDTSLKLNALVGGRLFPGKLHYTKFKVDESGGNYQIEFTSKDQTHIAVHGRESEELPKNSVFDTLEQASNFFKAGAAGYSPNRNKLDGMLLNAYRWDPVPLSVSYVKSSFFEDHSVFKPGSVRFDNALLMRNVEHDWKSLPDL